MTKVTEEGKHHVLSKGEIGLFGEGNDEDEAGSQ